MSQVAQTCLCLTRQPRDFLTRSRQESNSEHHTTGE